jgi:hypothetical protein
VSSAKLVTAETQRRRENTTSKQESAEIAESAERTAIADVAETAATD